jgi:hypothetical protein
MYVGNIYDKMRSKMFYKRLKWELESKFEDSKVSQNSGVSDSHDKA